jgi:hypothetical protein
MSLFEGTPGHRLTRQPNPTGSCADQPLALTSDPFTGEITMLGEGNDGLDTWSKLPGAAWSGPTTVPDSSAVSYRLQVSLTAAHGVVDLGISQQDGHGVLLATRPSPTSGWTAPARLPLTDADDHNLVLQASPIAGTLIAAYRHQVPGCPTGCSGIMTQRLPLGGSWTKPYQRTRWMHDYPTDISVRPSNRVSVSFRRAL